MPRATNRLVLIVGGLLSASVAFGGVVTLEPIAVTDGVPAWNEAFLERIESLEREGGLPADGYLECRETEELSRVYVCASHTQRDMNLALMRASVWVEGLDGNPKGTLLAPDDPELKKIGDDVSGHDLKGEDLLAFYTAVNERCEAQSGLCANANERAFFESFVLPLAAGDAPFVIIAYSVTPVQERTWHGTVSHEVLHAQYFMLPDYRKTITDFWRREMAAADKKLVRLFLRKDYAISDEQLLINEFQAYTLEAARENSTVPFIFLYRSKIEEALAALGRPELNPIQVKDTTANSGTD